jgi:signal peptidase II
MSRRLPSAFQEPGYAGGMNDPGLSSAVQRRVVAVVAVVAGATVAADQSAKFWAESALRDRAPIPLLGDFLSLRLLYNPGAAFSIGSDLTWVFTIAAAAAVIAIAWSVRRVRSSGWAVALGLLLGGAGTHLLDRLFRAPGFAVGHVVDFIDYNGWFVGNIADIALTFGAGLAILLSALGIGMDGQRHSRQPEQRTPLS